MASELLPDPFDDLSASPPPASQNRKKTWEELRHSVRKTRKLASSMLSRVPHAFTFRRIESENGVQSRIYFLGAPAGSRENTLLYVDLPQSTDSTDLDQLEWKPLLRSFQTTPPHGQFSKEEQLLRERKRLGSLGITSYDHDKTTSKFVFPACNSLFFCTDSLSEGKLQDQSHFPMEAKSSCVGTRLDPKLCPTNDNLLSFVCNSDIWITNTSNGHEKRLTFAHKGAKGLENDPLSAGVPSFVVQEEFDRYTGYWWQPKDTCLPGEKRVYRILYEEVDESSVEILHILSSTADDKGVDEYRYPRAGTPNACCNLKLLEFELDENDNFINVVQKELYEPLCSLFPWMEYIPRAGWTPDGKNVYVQLLDRKQQRLQLVLIPLHCFSKTSVSSLANHSGADGGSQTSGGMANHSDGAGSGEVMMQTDDETSALPLQVLYEDNSNVWINVHDIMHFLPETNPRHLSFIWVSDKSGFCHLYRVTVKLLTASEINQESLHGGAENHIDVSRANVLQEIPITSGDWEVSRKQIWVDEAKQLVYFTGLKDTPLESHLYVVSYDNPSTVVRLTQPGFSHTIFLDSSCSMFVSVYSNVNTAPSSQLYHLSATSEAPVVPHAKATILSSPALSEDYHPPELFSYDSESGHTMYGMFYRPHNIEPGQQCPTVLFVYGGPQVQLVTNAYKGIRFLRLHTLACHGYAVVVIDSRGSCHRGLEFESHIQSRLGQVEISDQVEGLHWLASQVDFIDLSRVAIHGWSYGGYLSLMGLCQRPDVFKVAIAGAPVTSWRLYDTGYTERYMDTPQRNEEGYKEGSVLQHVENFPSEENRLLLVHGLIDENVHFIHTSQLINSLVKASKHYQLQVYPNERHGIRNSEASEHYETVVLKFLQDNL